MLGRASVSVREIQTKHLARGKLTTRPWGLTLGALGLAGHTGQLSIQTADRKSFRLAFSAGNVIEATSPVSADELARIALTHRLIPAAHAAEIHKRVQRAPDKDELATFSEVAKLDHGEMTWLRWEATLQRAARTFAVEGGTFRFDRDVPVPTGSPVAIDIRAVIYLGARLHLDEDRVSEGLRQLGSRFALTAEGRGVLTRFGFTESEAPILEALERGTSVAEIEAAHREIDPRMIRAAIYALGCCDAIERVEAGSTKRPAETKADVDAKADVPAATARGVLSRRDIEMLIADRCSLLDAGRDLFAVLGLEFGAPVEAVRSAFLELATYIHPDKLAAAGISATLDAQRLYARAAVAFWTLSDDGHRAQYLDQHVMVANPQARTLELVTEADRASLARQAGLRAARLLEANRPGAAVAELAKACELAPADVDAAATLAWATFCAARHKQQVEAGTRKILEHAVEKSPHPEVARMYLGRMERMLGHDLEALQHFYEVLANLPDHVEAAGEIRVIEARIARGTRPLR